MHTTPFTHKQIVGENQVMMIGVKKPKKTLKNHYHFVVVLGPDKDNRLGKKTFVTFELKHQKMKMTNEWWIGGRVGKQHKQQIEIQKNDHLWSKHIKKATWNKINLGTKLNTINKKLNEQRFDHVGSEQQQSENDTTWSCCANVGSKKDNKLTEPKWSFWIMTPEKWEDHKCSCFGHVVTKQIRQIAKKQKGSFLKKTSTTWD